MKTFAIITVALFASLSPAGTITGKVVNPDGTAIAAGVSILAYDSATGALIGTAVVRTGTDFRLTINDARWPSARIEFQRHLTEHPQLTIPTATTDRDLGTIIIPRNKR